MNNFVQNFQERTFYWNPLLLLTSFISLIFIYKWFDKKNPKKQAPSPPRLPIIGNLHQLSKPLHRSLKSLSDKYGDLMLLQLGRKPTLIVSSANTAREIMRTHDLIFSNRPKLIAPTKLFYDGKDLGFSNYGEHWRQVKSICMAHLLSTKSVRSFKTVREEETSLMVEDIRRLIPDDVNLTKSIKTLTNNVVCRAALGRKYSADRGSNFMALLNGLVECLSAFAVGDFVPWFSWIDRLSGFEGKVSTLAKEFDVFFEGVIDEHMMHSGKTEETKDLVDILLQLQRDSTVYDFQIDRDCIKGVILDMFSGGTETTAAVIEWAMSELLRHPKTLEQLQEEVRRIARGKARVSEPDLDKMDYLKAVIKETLRLYPPGPLLIFRESSHDININGYDIPASTQVITNAWAIQRDPSFWKAPNEFRPERFLHSTVDFKGQHFDFIPFGSGRRSCPGMGFGTVTIELGIANLVYAFNWGLPGGAKCETLDMSETTGIALCRSYPLLAVATPYPFEKTDYT